MRRGAGKGEENKRNCEDESREVVHRRPPRYEVKVCFWGIWDAMAPGPFFIVAEILTTYMISYPSSVV